MPKKQSGVWELETPVGKYRVRTSEQKKSGEPTADKQVERAQEKVYHLSDTYSPGERSTVLKEGIAFYPKDNQITYLYLGQMHVTVCFADGKRITLWYR